jgi:molecular chaperone DnaK
MTPPRRTAKPETSSERDTPLRVIGIDLGTTNSTIAEVRWEPDGPMKVRCVEVDQPTHEGTYTHVLFPSVVAIHGDRVWVGEGAKRLRSRAPELGLEQNRNLFFECKNDVGIARTYHRAPEGFRSASEIGGRVLAALHAAARADDATPIERVVVTVPASFQAAQRRDTLEAARLAGLSLSGGDLLDEPLAAFLDYVIGKEGGEGRTGARALEFLTSPAVGMTEGLEGTLVVLDFGGGTCDVAVLRLQRDEEGRLAVSPLAVSRYHRLGGGDIDAAIVHEALIPEMVRENNLGPFDLTFEDKKKVLEPSLLGLAEALKIGVCSEVARLERFGKYEGADRGTIAAQQPITVEVRVGDRTLKLTRPRLSAAAFEKLLVPFLEHDLLYARETEYRLTSEDVNSFLMVGGSSLIPQVVREVRPFFPNARVLTYPDRESLQTAVARGAALHAAALALTGRGLVQPVANDSIALKAESRSLKLIRKGEPLPVPAEGAIRKTGLTVPATSQKLPVDVRVELVAGEGEQERPLFRGRWTVPPPVTKGEGLVLEYRLDANQILDLKLSLATRAGVGAFTCAVENPLTNVVNPQAARVKLDALEEDIRTGKVAKEDVQGALIEAAELMVELGHRERAFAQLKKVLQSMNRPDVFILNRMAILAGEMGDRDRTVRLFREAAAAGPRWSAPLFNLALFLERHGDAEGAMEAIEEALTRERDAPSLALRARLAGNRGDGAARERDLAEALSMFGPPQRLTEWALGWLISAAHMAGRKELEEAALAEFRLRKRQPEAAAEGGMLPGVRALELVEQ